MTSQKLLNMIEEDLPRMRRRLENMRSELKNRSTCPCCRQKVDPGYIIAQFEMQILKLELKVHKVRGKHKKQEV